MYKFILRPSLILFQVFNYDFITSMISYPYRIFKHCWWRHKLGHA